MLELYKNFKKLGSKLFIYIFWYKIELIWTSVDMICNLHISWYFFSLQMTQVTCDLMTILRSASLYTVNAFMTVTIKLVSIKLPWFLNFAEFKYQLWIMVTLLSKMKLDRSHDSSWSKCTWCNTVTHLIVWLWVSIRDASISSPIISMISACLHEAPD